MLICTCSSIKHLSFANWIRGALQLHVVDKEVLGNTYLCVLLHEKHHFVQGSLILLNRLDRMHKISFLIFAAFGLLFTTVLGLLNHGNISIVPDGTGIGDVWKKLYELQAQVLKGSHKNGELIRNQTALQTQMTDLRKENEELRKNQTLLTQGYSKMHSKVNQTMAMVNGLRKVNEELRMNHTSLQHEATHLKTVITSLVNTVSSIQTVTPVDVKLNLLNYTIQALHTVHSSTAAIVTSLQGKQNIMDGSILSLNVSLRHLHGSIGIDVAALNSSLMKLDQHVKNLSINVNKNSYGKKIFVHILGKHEQIVI